MGSTRPATKADDLEGNSSIQAFLACAINHALSTAAYLVEQLVVAEFHLHSALFLHVVFLVIERAQPSPKQTHAAKSMGGIGKDGRPAFCANSLNFIRRRAQSVSNLYVYCSKFFRGLRLEHRNEMSQLILDVAGHGDSLRDFVTQQFSITLTQSMKGLLDRVFGHAQFSRDVGL